MMSKQFNTISDFTKLKDKCLFCLAPLRVRLTNFLGVAAFQDYLPILNSPLKNGRFVFHISHTTETYNVEADGLIDTRTNKLALSLPDSNTPIVDQNVAKSAFVDMRPHIELYCPNKRCTNDYGLSSCPLEMSWAGSFSYLRDPNVRIDEWTIAPLRLFLETFRSGNLIVQNDWLRKETCIYSSNNETAEPIRTPMMDFEAMGADKTLGRIETYVTFS